MLLKMTQLDINYIRPDSFFIYNIYSENGEKLHDARTPLSSSKIKSIREAYGNYVYIDKNEVNVNEMEPAIPEEKLCLIRDKTKSILEEVESIGVLSKATYREAVETVETILDELNKTKYNVINLLKDLKSYEEYTYSHSVNVGILVAVFAQKHGLFSQDELKNLTLGAYLHDIGKMKIDLNIINKKGKLSKREMLEMKRHPQLGYEIIKRNGERNPIVQQSILFHHEKFQEDGYYGLPYNNLPVFSKIISICDIFDALTSKRPYRDALSTSDALKSIVNSINFHFDYNFVSNFINKMESLLSNNLSTYAVGDICELNSQELALIKELGTKDLLKPKVLVFCRFSKDKRGMVAKFYEEPFELDIFEDPVRIITKLICNGHHLNIIKERLKERKII
ncbi:MAG: HD domain-containing protein [Spirochaetota bacterium]|nr:HD domain-containing protein [Spirochaetota bacterium]